LKMISIHAFQAVLRSVRRNFRRPDLAAAVLGIGLGLLGCSTPTEYPQLPQDLVVVAKPEAPDRLILREGDTVRISFPGAPSFNATQLIRRDGKINLSVVGEVTAAGKTTEELEAELKKLYSPEIVTKEVIVTVESSIFEVYVTGAVLRPGKVISNRPLTALEAVMEAGGPIYTKANLKAVQVTRTNAGRMEHYTLNLKRVLEGDESMPFYLKPSDIIYVREKFQWF
jgi:polysaccharide biosynthesis/export protein